ncbi:hypothetical protein AGMMS4956_11730 [Bacteroidia bacterium]|nr:hypothetical protein AGMMS4956_11730 [Bacteroidia bacterium]
MEKIGLLNKIVKSVYDIYLGRKSLATEGAAEEGRIFLSRGLLSALAVFKEVYANAGNDTETVILVEHAYLTEERRYCSPLEPTVAASMTAALASFKDALRALKTVQNAETYLNAETTWPHLPKYRYHDMPKDAFHIACNANRTRINNTLRTPGINNVEREVYEQRSKNMTAIQAAYLNKQETALSAVWHR